MTEFTVKLYCPEDQKFCDGKEKCRFKGKKNLKCAIDALEIARIKREEYDPWVPWEARL